MVSQTTNLMTGEPAFAVDRSGEIIQWNTAAEKALGYPASAALGQQCWNFLCGQDSYGNQYCCERCPLREMAFRHESVNSFPATFKTASGGRKQFLISCLVTFDSSGNEFLLHICHPEKPARGNGFRYASGRHSVNNHRNTLTQREFEVLELLAAGKCTREIASLMFISTPTARNHIQHLLCKLNVHSRLEAVLLGKQLDLI